MFVTISLEPRRPLFGRVDHESVVLSEAGETAKRDLLEAAERFTGLSRFSSRRSGCWCSRAWQIRQSRRDATSCWG